MSMTRTSTVRSALDHFEPQDTTDPAAQRRLRGQLEQIDYAAFAANKEAIARVIGHASSGQFQRLAVAAAQARAHWAAEALALADAGHAPSPEEVAKLNELYAAFEAVSDAYEGLRRMVERGYLVYNSMTV
jgi:long-subunit acyl-CoA synthetase (AMP-forming)